MRGRDSHAGPTRLPMTTLAWLVLAPLALRTLVGLVLWRARTAPQTRPTDCLPLPCAAR